MQVSFILLKVLVVLIGCPLTVFGALEDVICTDLADNSIIPHPIECNLYLICENGHGRIETCPSGTWYNPNFHDCSLEYDLCQQSNEDSSKSPIETTTHSTTPRFSTSTNSNWHSTSTISTTSAISHSSTMLPPIATATPVPTTMPPATTVTFGTTILSTTKPETPPKCPSYDTQTPTYISSKLYCERYFLCYHGQAIPLRCPPNYHWNHFNKHCVIASETTCAIKIFDFDPECPDDGQHFYPHVDNCQYFYYCENGIRSVQQCDSFYHWDIDEKTCKLIQDANCIRNVADKMQAKKYF